MRKGRVLSAVLMGVTLALSVLVTGCASSDDMGDSGGGGATSSMGTPSSTGGY